VTGKWLRAACAAGAVAMIAAGCSSAGSSGTADATTAMKSMSFGAPEKTTLNVGVVPAMDSAGFFVALHEGLFKQEGLTINYTPAVSSDEVIDQQVQGKFDITAGNYVSYIQHEISDHQQLEIVSEGSIMEQGAQTIFTMPNSDIKNLSQLKGKLVGVNAPQNIAYLLAASVVQENGGSPSSVKFPQQQIPLPEMGQELDQGKIAAAEMPEPFASEAEQQYGAVPLSDLDQGATQQFPIEGYVVTKKWAQQNPNTLKRFLAALSEGQAISDSNRTAVESAFESLKGPQNGQVSATIASVMALDDYPIGVDPTRLQRVSDVMFQFGLEPSLKNAFNVSSMLMPASAFNFTPFESGVTSS
jgi:NitT/TauT family transport system substrate-binding protein